MILILVLRQLADGASSPRFITASADEIGFLNGRHRSSPCVPTAQPNRLTLDSIEPLQTSSRHLQPAAAIEVGREARSLFRRAKDLPGCRRSASDRRPRAAPKIRDWLVTTEKMMTTVIAQLQGWRGRVAFSLCACGSEPHRCRIV